MLAPIRVKGATGGTASPLAGMIVEYESPEGYSWLLTSPSREDNEFRNVFLVEDGVTGLEGRVDRGESVSVSRYGARPQGWKIPPLDITLDYQIRAERGELESVARSWRQAWEFEEPGDYGPPEVMGRGRITVRSDIGGRFWTPVSSPVFPDWPNDLRGSRVLTESLSCKGWLGHWFGDTETYTGDASVRVKGDRPLSPAMRLVWDGSATSVTFPSGLTVNLTAFGQPRFINLDRGMSGQVTRPDGTVDTVVWSALQGIISGISLRPGSVSEWTLGTGLTLEVTPRYLSPWR